MGDQSSDVSELGRRTARQPLFRDPTQVLRAPEPQSLWSQGWSESKPPWASTVKGHPVCAK
eukprot:4098314-Amphidinium_carterae.1